MSADTFVAYCGLRFEVTPDEIEDVESRTDARILMARKFGIKFHYGNFGGHKEYYLLFIGTPIGIFGIENTFGASLSLVELQELFQTTEARLFEAGFEEKPALHFELEPDF